MEKIDVDDRKTNITQDKAYFHSGTHINLESTDDDKILGAMIEKINLGIDKYQEMFRNLTVDSVIDLLEKRKTNKGYIFEVDLDYPSELWDKHNDYPLAPEKMVVNGVDKLTGSFKPRSHYVVHYRNPKQYLEMGMRLTAVHRGISFYQSPWMAPYIAKSTELRKTAANIFEKDFFKLMNNSMFGKTIENIRKRQNVVLIDNRREAAKLSTRPNFDRATIFDRNLIAVHMKRTDVYLN